MMLAHRKGDRQDGKVHPKAGQVYCLETALAARPRVMLWRGSLTLCATAAPPCMQTHGPQ